MPVSSKDKGFSSTAMIWTHTHQILGFIWEISLIGHGQQP
jgi:hypothetical protein